MEVNAATLSTAPAIVNVVAGQTFSLPVTVDTQGAKVVTVKAQIVYPAGAIEATGFSFGSGWTQLSQPGYDSMGSGTMIKTAGFPSGFTGTKVLGTATFRALTAGQATITFSNSGSLALSDQSQTLPLSSSGTSVIVSASASAGGQAQAGGNAASNSANAATGSNNANNSATPATPASDSSDQSASVVDALGDNGTSTDDLAAAGAVSGAWERLKSNWWWLVLLLAILGGTWWFTRTPKEV